MIRWRNVIDAILSRYPGAEVVVQDAQGRWQMGGALDRIVIYPTDGVINEPSIAAQGIELADLGPSAIAANPNAIDDIVFQREVNTTFEIWAPDADKAETRLHALLVAIAETVNTVIQIRDLRESWIQAQGDITSGGCMVVLVATLTIFVVRGDSAVLANADPIGSGTPTSAVTSTEIDGFLDDEAIAPAIVEVET